MRKAMVGFTSLVLVAALAVGAEGPEKLHPNLSEAHKLCHQAYEKIAEAQKANEWDMDGHAKHAKELLEQVNAELKIAAEDATKHK